MPTLLASEVMQAAAVHLNDAQQEIFTNAAQLPYLQLANTELEDELDDYGIPVQKEVSATIAVLANATTVSLPSDLITPTKLYERPSGSSLDFEEVDEKAIEPAQSITSEEIVWWVWREQEIKINPPSTNREVRIDYTRTISVITSNISTIEPFKSKLYLAAKTAQYCALFIGRNPVAAADMERIAAKHLHKLLKRGVRANQSQRTRKKPFRPRNLRGRLL